MVEIDLIFEGRYPEKNTRTWYMGFFFTQDRSDEILEVGMIEIELLQFSLN